MAQVKRKLMENEERVVKKKPEAVDDPYVKQYNKLVGGVIMGVVVDPGDGSSQPIYGLQMVMKDSGKVLLAWISQDEENNGPGFLHIEEDKS